MFISCNNMKGVIKLSDIKRMIAEYNHEAKRLAEYKKRLEAEMKEERDTDKLRELELRKSTVEAERYEILADMKEMIAYETERSKCIKGA